MRRNSGLVWFWNESSGYFHGEIKLSDWIVEEIAFLGSFEDKLMAILSLKPNIQDVLMRKSNFHIEL